MVPHRIITATLLITWTLATNHMDNGTHTSYPPQFDHFTGPQHTPPRIHPSKIHGDTDVNKHIVGPSIQTQTTTNNSHSRPLLFSGVTVLSSPQHRLRNTRIARVLFGGDSKSDTSSKKRRPLSPPRAGGAMLPMQLHDIGDDDGDGEGSTGVQSGYETPRYDDMVGGGVSALDTTPPQQIHNADFYVGFHGPGAPSRRDTGTNEASPLRLFGFVEDDGITIQNAIHRLKTQNTSNAEEVVLPHGCVCTICQELVNTGDIVRRVCDVTIGNHWICQTCCEHAQFPHHACPTCRGVKPGEIFIARKARIS